MTSRLPRRGLLIALEGIDGAGKSTLQRALARRWRSDGIPVVCRREPGHPELAAAALRQTERDPWSAGIFFTIDRWRMRPELERRLRSSVVVLLDRSFYSTLAYQGSQLPPADRRRLELLQHRVAIEPDHVFLLALPVSDALRRLGGRRGRRAPVERARTLGRVARAYSILARRPRWTILRATDPVDKLVREATQVVRPLLRRRIPATREGP